MKGTTTTNIIEYEQETWNDIQEFFKNSPNEKLYQDYEGGDIEITSNNGHIMCKVHGNMYVARLKR